MDVTISVLGPTTRIWADFVFIAFVVMAWILRSWECALRFHQRLVRVLLFHDNNLNVIADLRL